METYRIASRQYCFPPSVSCCYSSKELLKQSAGSVVMQCWRRVGGKMVVSNGFSDRGHLTYYGSYPVAEFRGEKKSKVKNKKKKEHKKLLKGLSRDLATFSQIGFGLDSNSVLVDEDKENKIPEAAELLREHLQKLRSEEKELKTKQREEKVRLKAIKMQKRLIMRTDSSSSSSSSSSSESSSDSKCGKVIEMKSLKRAQKNIIAHPPAIEEETSQSTTPIASETTQAPVLARNEQCSQAGTSCTSLCDKSRNSMDVKIEVCMGGKCKKAGAGELLDKFRSVVGIEGSGESRTKTHLGAPAGPPLPSPLIEGAVSGCKCMGKCRDGPNVKVLNRSVRARSNVPLCTGVGLEDVDMIVANTRQNGNEFAA